MTTSSLERMSWAACVVRPRRTGGGRAVSEVILDPETALAAHIVYEIAEGIAFHGLLGVVDRTALADDDDFHLARILHLVLDLLGDVVGKTTDSASSTTSGSTMTRTSRPAWMA